MVFRAGLCDLCTRDVARLSESVKKGDIYIYILYIN